MSASHVLTTGHLSKITLLTLHNYQYCMFGENMSVFSLWWSVHLTTLVTVQWQIL